MSGCTDYFAADEHEAYTTARDTVATFNIDVPDSPPVYDEPLYSTEDIPALIPRDDLRDMNIKSVCMYSCSTQLTEISLIFQ